MSVHPELTKEFLILAWENALFKPEYQPQVVDLLCGVLNCIDFDYLKKGSKQVLADLKRQNRIRDRVIASDCYEILGRIDSLRAESL